LSQFGGRGAIRGAGKKEFSIFLKRLHPLEVTGVFLSMRISSDGQFKPFSMQAIAIQWKI
jgi:hypothetical protein